MFSKMKNYAEEVELYRAFTDAVYALYQSDAAAKEEIGEKVSRFFDELAKVHNCRIEGVNRQTYVFCHILQYIAEEDEFYGAARTNMRELLNPFVHLVKLYSLFCSLSGGLSREDKDVVPSRTYRKL